MKINMLAMIVGIIYFVSAISVYFTGLIIIDNTDKKESKKISFLKNFFFWTSTLPCINTLFLVVALWLSLKENPDQK